MRRLKRAFYQNLKKQVLIGYIMIGRAEEVKIFLLFYILRGSMQKNKATKSEKRGTACRIYKGNSMLYNNG